MSTLADLAVQVTGWIPKIPPDLASILTNRAYRAICNSRNWSFLVESAQVYTPDLLDVGTVAVVQWSNQVTGDATASAAWLAQVLNTGAPFTSRQFRVSATGPIYQITAADVSNPAAIVLTISSGAGSYGYSGTTDAAATYQIYRCYIDVPDPDFLRWISFYDPSSGYYLAVNRQQAQINKKDPLRSQQGQPYWVCNSKGTSTGAPQFELWPGPTFEKAYQTLYQRRGADLASGDSFPVVLTDELIVSRTLVEGGMWGLANQGAMPELRGVDWRFFISTGQSQYDKQLIVVKKTDEETYIQTLIRRQVGAGFPLDGKYLQSHAPYGPFGGY